MSKGSAISELAKRLKADPGSDDARTDLAPGNVADEGEVAFEAEIDLFRESAIAPPRRKPGRPAGAQDRSTVQLAAWMRAKGYRDPAEFLASIVSMDLHDLEKLVDGKTPAVDALRIQVQAAKELMPYVHRKRPIEVEHTGDGARPLIILADDLRRVASRANGALSIYDGEDNQSLISRVANGSHDDGSHDPG
jgi:hypothetical protein